MIELDDAVVAAVVGGPLGEVVIRRRRAGLRITGVEKVIEVEAERVGLLIGRSLGASPRSVGVSGPGPSLQVQVQRCRSGREGRNKAA